MTNQTPLNATLSITHVYDARTKTVSTRVSQIVPPHAKYLGNDSERILLLIVRWLYQLVFVDPAVPSSSACSRAAFASTLKPKNQYLQCQNNKGIRTHFVPVFISIFLERAG